MEDLVVLEKDTEAIGVLMCLTFLAVFPVETWGGDEDSEKRTSGCISIPAVATRNLSRNHRPSRALCGSETGHEVIVGSAGFVLSCRHDRPSQK